MSKKEKTKILSTIEDKDFIGRNNELKRLINHSKGKSNHNGMLFLSEPAQGGSELLKQIFDLIFVKQGKVIPIYFAFKKSDKTLKDVAIRFLNTFLEQAVAFRTRDFSLIESSSNICEISERSKSIDGTWIKNLIKACSDKSELNNEYAFVRQAFSASLRANADKSKTFLILDNFEALENIAGGLDFIEELKDIFKRSECPFVFAGKRRFLLNAMFSGKTKLNEVARLNLNSLNDKQSVQLINHLAEKNSVTVNGQTSDLINQQLSSSPVFIRDFLDTAKNLGSQLTSFKDVQTLYTEELFGGKIKAFYDSIFNEIIPNIRIQKQFIDLIYNALTLEKERVPIESWRKHIDLTESEFYRVVALLNYDEIITISSNMVAANSNNEILTDYITKRFRLEIRSDKRALAFSETLSEFLKKAPLTMSKFYRGQSSIGLGELLTVFNCQEIPISLLFYNVFKELHKGKDSETIFAESKSDPEKLQLPQIVWTANTAAFYPSISQLTEKERSSVALGFESAEYTDENEVVWLVAEVDSKLEANAELTKFWCDRLEIIALMCDFEQYRLWLVSPEGFDQEAIDVLNERNAVGSSRQQVELLAKFLNAEDLITKKDDENEFQMVIPMGDDTELIAAYAIEELARKHSFEPKAINQIKTALVEACINATEHSHSPDRKIYQKFNLDDDKISITVSNRGLRFNGNNSEEFVPDEGRRGWGLKLMKSLMDEVKFENVDDGTKISLVKYLE